MLWYVLKAWAALHTFAIQSPEVMKLLIDKVVNVKHIPFNMYVVVTMYSYSPSVGRLCCIFTARRGQGAWMCACVLACAFPFVLHMLNACM